MRGGAASTQHCRQGRPAFRPADHSEQEEKESRAARVPFLCERSNEGAPFRALAPAAPPPSPRPSPPRGRGDAVGWRASAKVRSPWKQSQLLKGGGKTQMSNAPAEWWCISEAVASTSQGPVMDPDRTRRRVAVHAAHVAAGLMEAHQALHRGNRREGRLPAASTPSVASPVAAISTKVPSSGRARRMLADVAAIGGQDPFNALGNVKRRQGRA